MYILVVKVRNKRTLYRLINQNLEDYQSAFPLFFVKSDCVNI